MIIIQAPLFGKQKKKLHANQITVLEDAIATIAKNPMLGVPKKGDLQSVRVYKFKIHKQEYLLAYVYTKNQILLLVFGTHENFYRDLKK